MIVEYRSKNVKKGVLCQVCALVHKCKDGNHVDLDECEENEKNIFEQLKMKKRSG